MGRIRKKKSVETVGPTPEQLARGDYEAVEVELESHQDKRAATVRNFARTTIDRWRRNRLLTDKQYRACEHYRDTYEASGLLRRVTSAYEGRITMAAQGFGPGNTQRQCEALSDLVHWSSFLPSKYLDVFTNVVVFDWSTGEAGAQAGYTSATAEAAAKRIVEFCADVLAMRMRM